MNLEDEDDDGREFPPAEEIVFRLDTVMDCLDTVERIICNADDLVVPDADRRRMRAILDEMSKQADELFDLARHRYGPASAQKSLNPYAAFTHAAARPAASKRFYWYQRHQERPLSRGNGHAKGRSGTSVPRHVSEEG